MSGDPLQTYTPAYGDDSWGDLLTAYDGVPITYDTIGNPLNDGTWTYTWRNGRELASMSNGTTTWNYTYDANGMRTSRTNGTKTYNYVYNGGQLTQMTVGNDTLYFIYDATGAPVIVVWNDVVYYYVTTLQGDVLLILDEDGEIVVSYDYDAWGNVLNVGGPMANTLGTLNPLRYRGYVYDQETQLYYLQSRYYTPEIGRFINADTYTTTGQGLLGNNMFAYCNNNPVNAKDPSGHALTRVAIYDDLTVNIFFGSGGGGGGGSGYALVGAGGVASSLSKVKKVMNNTSEAVVQQDLKSNGAANYNGVSVFLADLPGEHAAFSFGVIVMDVAYKDAPIDYFAKTLNHEYGHAVHFQQIGLPAYTITTAFPSLVSAGLASISPTINDYYYNLPYERIADYLGGVNRGYTPGANTMGSLYWLGTVIFSLMLPF